MKQLWVFRHGQTDWNLQERFQGHLDIPLNDPGREQARQLTPKLKNNGIQALLTSDLIRAYETAKIVADQLDLPVFQDVRLREAHLGAAQGMTRAEIEAQFGVELVQRWKSSQVSDADVSYPGGETASQVMTRVAAALEDFLQTHPFEIVGVATHGGVIRRLMQIVMPAGSSSVPIPNVVLYRINYDPRTRKLSRG